MAGPTKVTRTFRTTFDLTGLDPTTAVINGLWGVDVFGEDMLLNGVSLVTLSRFTDTQTSRTYTPS